MICDWWISIRFVCFGFVARDCSYDWQVRKMRLWRQLLNFRVFVKRAVINPTIQNPSFYKFLLQCTVCAKCNWVFSLPLVISGAVEHGNHYTLNLVYEHILERTACNMTYGPFGGVKSEFSCYVHCTCLFVVCELYWRQNTCSSRAVIREL